MALVPFALHALARAVDRGLGVLLHTSLDLPQFVPLALGLVDWGAAGRAALAWTAAGAGLWWAAAALGRRGDAASGWERALGSSAWLFLPLLLRPALTLLALGALAWQPTYPYGFTLPVALTQDWGFAQDAAAGAALVAGWLAQAGWLGARRAPRGAAAGAARRDADWRPRTGDVFLWAFLAYGFLTPAGSRHFDAHPGNEPKYLRMALALGHGLTLDVDSVVAPMEALPVTAWRESLPRAVACIARAAAELAASLARGGPALGVPAGDAGVAHLTVRGRDGGAYHVLAPGPSLLLAPALRLDRALNLRRGTPGRLGLTLLLWNALAAALVAAVFAFARAASRHPVAAALAALAAALVPPLLFYSFQFYPELPAALLLVLALRRLVFFERAGGLADAVRLGLVLAPLPWLHQKYLPLWGLLVAWAAWRTQGAVVPRRALVALLLPQAASLALFALYNFAVTGSARPDALFRALGREGVSLAHLGQGALGLLLDARYGILPYVPLALLAVAGVFLPGDDARRLRRALPAAAAYYLTVAAAENWTGSISNLGRFVLPLCPLAAAFAALVLRDAWRRPALLALLLALGAWTARLTLLLWNDPHAANDSAVLLGRSSFADGHVYLPNLLLRTWSDAAPALGAQLAAFALALGAVVAAFRRGVVRSPALTANPGAAAAALALLAGGVLAAAFGLERWPGRRGSARFANALRLDPSTTVFVPRGAELANGVFHGGGEVALLVRSARPVPGLMLRLAAPARVAVNGGALASIPAGALLRVPLEPPLRLRGRRGHEECLAPARLRLGPAANDERTVPFTLAATR